MHVRTISTLLFLISINTQLQAHAPNCPYTDHLTLQNVTIKSITVNSINNLKYVTATLDANTTNKITISSNANECSFGPQLPESDVALQVNYTLTGQDCIIHVATHPAWDLYPRLTQVYCPAPVNIILKASVGDIVNKDKEGHFSVWFNKVG